ncbi:TPA: hypothetical protein L4R50_000324 [Pseudomonas aeruginosa]|nr:hypothetical protein [Pseudomonas aeruginosa]
MGSSISFVGSNGLMDVPAPKWIKADATLFASWGQLLLAMIKHGTVETVRKGDLLSMKQAEFGLLIDGGLYATDSPPCNEARALLIDFLRRGDLFSPAISSNLKITLSPHCKTTCLIVREDSLRAFKAEFEAWDMFEPILCAEMAQAYSQAVSASIGKDQEKIRRVLSIMANHPTAIDSKLGREIEAGKQLIRDLAGVQKRSATRAFRCLEEAGEVSFYGYKRLFYRGQHPHQKA